LKIEGSGQYKISTGIRFFDHMLELFTRHGAFDLELACNGDLDVDQHHTVEDVGIALGEAFDRALGDKRGILRAGYFLMPMDETLAIAAIDLSGRAPSPSKPKCARAWSATCKPNWSPISSKALRAAHAPTFT
jgi:imidazoleglycerol-phosphate dehydratase